MRFGASLLSRHPGNARLAAAALSRAAGLDKSVTHFWLEGGVLAVSYSVSHTLLSASKVVLAAVGAAYCGVPPRRVIRGLTHVAGSSRSSRSRNRCSRVTVPLACQRSASAHTAFKVQLERRARWILRRGCNGSEIGKERLKRIRTLLCTVRKARLFMCS